MGGGEIRRQIFLCLSDKHFTQVCNIQRKMSPGLAQDFLAPYMACQMLSPHPWIWWCAVAPPTSWTGKSGGVGDAEDKVWRKVVSLASLAQKQSCHYAGGGGTNAQEWQAWAGSLAPGSEATGGPVNNFSSIVQKPPKCVRMLLEGSRWVGDSHRLGGGLQPEVLPPPPWQNSQILNSLSEYRCLPFSSSPTLCPLFYNPGCE